MMQPVPLSAKLGEVMAPNTLVTALVLSPDGDVVLDAGALHGRSAVEGPVAEWVKRREDAGHAASYWMIWVAVELDAAQQPLRYLGIAASEVLINAQDRLGYKSVAGQVNRMAEAMQGRVSLEPLSFVERQRLREELIRLDPEAWERSASLVKDTLTASTP